MYSMRLLNAADLSCILVMKDVTAAVEKAYRLFSRGEAGLYPIISHEFEPEKKEMDIKSGHLKGAGIYGLKIVGYSAENPVKRGVPALAGLVVVMNIETGQPLGLVDGMTVTNMRTGAAGAVGARTLARKDSENVLVLGTGAQGRAQMEGLLEVMPEIRTVRAAGRTRENVEEYAENMHKRFPEVEFLPVPFEDIQSAAEVSDIIVTCTPSHEPIIKRGWVRPGTHITAIGADFPGKQELDEYLTGSATVVADSREQVIRQGECRKACESGLLPPAEIREIGDILEGKAEGRTSPEDITIFDSTGMALQDILTADLAIERAEENGTGTIVEM